MVKKIKKIFHIFIGSGIALFALSSCTKLLLGQAELGSKTNPIKIGIDSRLPLLRDELAQFMFEDCVEHIVGYRISLNYLTDDKSLIRALSDNLVQFGILDSVTFMGTAMRSPFESPLLFSKHGQSLNRSVIFGRRSVWLPILKKNKIYFNTTHFKHEDALSILNKNIIAYVTPLDSEGFLLPRMHLMKDMVFPEGVLFTGSYAGVFAAINSEMALAGAVSDAFILESWPATKTIELGDSFAQDEYLVLGLSQSVPGITLIENPSVSNVLSNSVVRGFTLCSQKDKNLFKKLFAADGVQPPSSNSFLFSRDLYIFKQENIRILVPQTQFNLPP